MKKKTKKQKLKELVDLLRAIKNKEKHTKRSDILAPLSAAALITIKRKPNFLIESAELTDWGETFLKFETEKFDNSLNP